MFAPTGIGRTELEAKRRHLLRRGGKQILLLASGGRIFAIANRCPHEGYPLSEGTEGPGCVLTCNWHNWKFDLASGQALVGRDPVRTYAVQERNGEIFVDLSDQPADALYRRATQGLEAALADNDMPRMAREAARLERAGFDDRRALIQAFITRNDRLENGMTHAHAAAADWLSLAERAPSPEKRFAALLEPLGHIAWDTQGAGEFPYADRVDAWNPQRFLAAVESEDEPAAIAAIRGALADNIPYPRLMPVLGEAALSHYADFGHCAIYTLKTGQLIERLGNDIAGPALLALVRMLVRATREERLPEFRSYDKALAAWDGRGNAPALTEHFVGLSIDGAMRRTLESSARPSRELFDALLGAAAWNLAHFDTTFEYASDNAIADNVSWLDFTHALTFANACRHICAERPDLWPRAALQMALFVGRNRKYAHGEEDISRWRVGDRAAFLASEMDNLFDHAVVEPIIACHRLKVLFALEDELKAQPGSPWADEMCLAVNRYLNTPAKRHHGLRIAAQARDFVAKEG